MSLYKNQIPAVLRRRRAPKMAETDFVQSRGGLKRSNVSTDIGGLVRFEHHRHCVPADIRADAVLNRLVAWKFGLTFHANRIDVGCGGLKSMQHTIGARV